MKRHPRSTLKTIGFTCLTASIALTAHAQEIDTTEVDTEVNQSGETIEEVIVTGSYIKSSPLDAPSPVQVIDRNSIEAQGASVIWDVIRNLEVNSGSITNPGSGDRSQTEGTANVNLRNLGENSTLTLINGRRQVSAALTTQSGGEYVDLNTIPLVMTDRIEVLTDGGSALYGSDAVAGVVNIIMRTDFEGFELYGDVQGVTEASGLYDTTVSGIWGTNFNGGDTHLVLSAEYFDRDPVGVEHANFYDGRSEFTGRFGAAPSSENQVLAVPSFGANLNLAYINSDVIAQNIMEDDNDELVYTDPLCSTFAGTTVGTLRDDRGERSGACREGNAEWNYITHGADRASIAGSFSHSFSDAMEFYSFFQASDSETRRADDGYNTARGPSVFLAPPGSHSPTTNPDLAPLIPAGVDYNLGTAMELGYFAPEIGQARPTAADIPNNPNELANGGLNVPYWTSISTGWPRTGGDDNITRTKGASLQLGLRGDFAINDRSYDYDVGLSFSNSSLEQDYRTFQRDRAELAANGLGGPNCQPNGDDDFDFLSARGADLVVPGVGVVGGAPTAWDFVGSSYTQTFFPGFVFTTREALSLALTSNNHGQGGCMFYNPLLTSLTNPNLANDPELIEWMNPIIRRTDKRNKLGVLDAVISGEMFDMTGGAAQFAAGIQYRQQTNGSRANRLNVPGLPNAILEFDGPDADDDPDATHYVSNNFECSLCSFNYDHERNIKAAFAELSLPFLDNIETQFALRWEDYGGSIGSDVTSKFAISWRPIDTVLLRASYSESFRAPNIGIVEEGLESSAATFRDPLRNQAVRAGILPPTNENAEPNFTYTLGEPAPEVGNETADTYNIGVIWTPTGTLDGFSAQADFWHFDVQDRVLPEPPISAIQPEIDAFLEASQDPNNYVFNGSISSQAPVPYEACDPNDPNLMQSVEDDDGNVVLESAERIECVVDPRTYVVPGIVRAANSTTAALITTTLSAINAGTIEANGVDVKMGYAWNTDLGTFSLGFDYTHVNKYELIDVPGLELGLLETGVLDAAGTTGDGSLVRSLPDNKGHVTLSWLQENHGVTLIGRYIGSYTDLAYDNEFQTGNDFVRSNLSREIDSYNTWDIQYNYTHYWDADFIESTRFTVGLIDMFNADLPYREASSLNYDSTVFDGRGRRFYLRALAQF